MLRLAGAMVRAPVDMPMAWVEDTSGGRAPGVIAAGLPLLKKAVC
jgi:hypothetical protein